MLQCLMNAFEKKKLIGYFRLIPHVPMIYYKPTIFI